MEKTAAAIARASSAVYLRIRRTLEEQIATGHSPGDVLPSEETLARRFGVNRHTIRRALQGLSDTGLIERRRGLGSLIVRLPGSADAAGRVEYRMSERTRFSQLSGTRGRRTGVKVLGRRQEPGDPGTRRLLGIAEGEPLLLIETLRTVDQLPFCLTTHHFPLRRMGDVADRYKGGPLHAWIEKAYGWTLYRASSAATVALPDEADAAHLSIARTQPILIVRSVNLLARDGSPVEVAITRFRGDRVELHVTF